MAKKKASRSDFNMSSEIRQLLEEDRNLNSREVFEKLQEKFPGRTINRNSCNVAFSQARRRMGIRPGSGRTVRRRRPGMRTASAQTGALDFTLLKAAREFIAQAGSPGAAISAIEQIQELQFS
jgi:hypothetical protein